MDILSQLKSAKNILQNNRTNREQAFQIYYDTALNGTDKYASYRLGVCYEKGIVVEKNEEKAIEQYKLSAEVGYVEAQRKLGRFLKGSSDAIKWLEQAVAQGDIDAKFDLADALICDEDIDNQNKGMQMLHDLSNNDRTGRALFEIGERYCSVVGRMGWYKNFRAVEQDDTIALYWYEKSASYDYPIACSRVSSAYIHERGAAYNREKIREYQSKEFKARLQRAIMGDVWSMSDVATFYELGSGVEKNEAEAAKWEAKYQLALKTIEQDELCKTILDDLNFAIKVYTENKTCDFITAVQEEKTTEQKEETTESIIEEFEEPTNDSTIGNVLSVIRKIKDHCAVMDKLSVSIANEYQAEKQAIENKSSEMIKDMQTQFVEFKYRHFGNIKDEVKTLVELLCADYQDEWNKVQVSVSEFSECSFDENEKKLHDLVRTLNSYVDQINNVNFDKLVPPVKCEIRDEIFVTYTGNHENEEQHDVNSKQLETIRDSKPVCKLVSDILPCCRRIELCIDALVLSYEKEFNIAGFEAYVNSSARAWLSETKAKLDSKYSKKFDELFRDEKAEAIPKTFFTRLQEAGELYDIDLEVGTSAYNEYITIGDMRLLVTDESKHLSYIQDSPTLRQHLDGGYLSAPLVLDLKNKGNILLNIKEDTYSAETVHFVNQLIIQFLLSFPANRINFCLIDIDNKMGFSQFKSLTKINNNILYNGIIRDDRQLENTIKDMEQTMYKIDDDILSYNNVADIYEYNSNFEANPQNVHLFVLVNYPSGMRDDTAKRVQKIIQNGNKAGIFSIIINNDACPLSPGFKPAEHKQFIENVKPTALVINKTSDGFKLNFSIKNRFEPKWNITTSSLAYIVEMLKNNAESNRQKVIPLSQMFEDTDKKSTSPKGIAASEEVLDIPIGARGGEIQNLLLKTTGDGSAHAVLIGGTGSGKSNLLHTIIMSACYKYSPDELNLYLVDFKGGVEFKYYEANKIKEKQMPHIKLTGLTSDLEDGVAILNNLHKELRRREDEFRRCRVEDIVQYRNLGKKIPRLFVIIDEIQELFEQDDRLGQKAIDILRELFKKGRAFGINILWASQNIPNAPGLKDKVLSQIGNRISLRLNEPDDALDIKIDPKVVKNLNRPEKGLGVINDIRYGNESVEFRVAYAETSENRQKYSQQIIDKWSKDVTVVDREPLFIVGDDDEPSPIVGNTIYTVVPTQQSIVSKSFDYYTLQIGQDYVTGKPFDLNVSLRENKSNVLFAGYDVETLRDMMGYSLLSVAMNQITNLDCVETPTKIYYANGEMINPKNTNDLFNIIRNDFAWLLENVSSTEKMVKCIKDIYRIYKERSLDADTSEYAKAYTPYFLVIHSLQRYTDIFNENPMLSLKEESNVASSASGISVSDSKNMIKNAASFFEAATTPQSKVATASSTSSKKMPDSIFFSDAFKELLDRGGKYGIHFIISVDNPLAIQSIKNEMTETMFKVFVKGVNANVVSQMLGDYKIANSLSNPKVALVSMQDERTKIRVYRYDDSLDEKWYKKLCNDYSTLAGKKQ